MVGTIVAVAVAIAAMVGVVSMYYTGARLMSENARLREQRDRAEAARVAEADEVVRLAQLVSQREEDGFWWAWLRGLPGRTDVLSPVLYETNGRWCFHCARQSAKTRCPTQYSYYGDSPQDALAAARWNLEPDQRPVDQRDMSWDEVRDEEFTEAIDDG